MITSLDTTLNLPETDIDTIGLEIGTLVAAGDMDAATETMEAAMQLGLSGVALQHTARRYLMTR